MKLLNLPLIKRLYTFCPSQRPIVTRPSQMMTKPASHLLFQSKKLQVSPQLRFRPYRPTLITTYGRLVRTGRAFRTLRGRMPLIIATIKLKNPRGCKTEVSRIEADQAS